MVKVHLGVAANELYSDFYIVRYADDCIIAVKGMESCYDYHTERHALKLC